jgi:hypothetical protein
LEENMANETKITNTEEVTDTTKKIREEMNNGKND